jgi:uncharacterized protein YndB with AHSA1/START domain
MPTSFEVSTILPVKPERLYKAWLDSTEHGEFTGSPAEIVPKVGGEFTAWDGYIQGVNLELAPYRRILQSWRAEDFPPDASDSRLEVLLDVVPDGTRLTLIHSNLPEGQAEEFKQGWIDFYFTPMKAYFTKDNPE